MKRQSDKNYCLSHKIQQYSELTIVHLGIDKYALQIDNCALGNSEGNVLVVFVFFRGDAGCSFEKAGEFRLIFKTKARGNVADR